MRFQREFDMYKNVGGRVINKYLYMYNVQVIRSKGLFSILLKCPLFAAQMSIFIR